MKNFLAWLRPSSRGDSKRVREKREEDVENAAGAISAAADSSQASGPGKCKTAFHESIWKSGEMPPNVPRPETARRNINGKWRTRVVTTNLLVMCVGAPGVGLQSFINRVRFGDMERSTPPGHFAAYPPQYLCDGTVYSLGLTRLPATGLRGRTWEDVAHLALVIAYAVDSKESLEEAKRLQLRIFREVEAPDKPPVPVMLLGLKTDLRQGDLGYDLVVPSTSGTASSATAADITEETREESTEEEKEEARQRERQRVLESWSFAWSRSMLHAEVSASTGDGVLPALGRLVEEVDRCSKADEEPEGTAECMRSKWIPRIVAAFESKPGPDADAGVEMPEEAGVEEPGRTGGVQQAGTTGTHNGHDAGVEKPKATGDDGGIQQAGFTGTNGHDHSVGVEKTAGLDAGAGDESREAAPARAS